MPFDRDIRENALVAAARHCCVCHKYKGVKVEVHHIIPEEQGGKNTFENAIALCFDCHADAGHYFSKHPKGSKFSPDELKKHRDKWYEIVKCNKIQVDESLSDINTPNDVKEIIKNPLKYLSENIILKYDAISVKDKIIVKYNDENIGRVDGKRTTLLWFELWNKTNVEIVFNQIIMQNIIPFHYSSEYWDPIPTKGLSDDHILRELLYRYRHVNNSILAPNRYINIMYQLPLLRIDLAKKFYDFTYSFNIEITIPSKSLNYEIQDIKREIKKEFYIDIELEE